MNFPEQQGTWDEEQMCYLQAAPREGIGGTRRFVAGLRNELSTRNVVYAAKTRAACELTGGAQPSVIYHPGNLTHGNFMDASYRRIIARPEWRGRLEKVHTARRQATAMGPDEEVRRWKELDASTSSDALLMNIFCYPRVMTKKLCLLLGCEPDVAPQFGHKPHVTLRNGLVDQTEIDMKLGSVLVEAKLTESDFQQAPLRLLERYVNFNAIFNPDLLHMVASKVQCYQLIRGVLAADAEQTRYCVFLDGRRTDLLEQWFSVIRAVQSYELQSRLRVVTWQEISEALPKRLQIFLSDKYGIHPASRSKGGV